MGILSGNTSEYVEAYYGAPMAGMALTLVNPRLVAREVAYILSNAEVSAVAGTICFAIVGVDQ